ncbi:GNAT family N-acetyltransferase [Clostridiaceae bacterium HSG29]|nr:GNAT family N-acetyltransferase [Clostridiaceae bacterium HSG29]
MEKNKLKNLEEYKIRKVEVRDAGKMIMYLNKISTESDNLTFGEGEMSITLKAEIKFIEKSLKSNNQYFVLAEYNGEIIGNLSFSSGIKPRNRHQGEFGVSVLKKYWGNGVGYVLISGLIKWAREDKIITKINLQVKSDNNKGIELYERMGFEKEGLIKRGFLIDGKYYDLYHMGLIIE